MQENVTVIKRTNQQVRRAIHGFWDGRDEMNLVEFPIALLAERAPIGVYTLEFSDVFSDWQHHRTIHRHVTIAGTPKYGLPTAKDEEVLLGLLQLTKIINEFTSPRVEFSHIPSLLVVKTRRLLHPLEILKPLVHLGSSATPTI